MGAWIEIAIVQEAFIRLTIVAPFMGAWIEISCKLNTLILPPVAPFMGAWIEIKSASNSHLSYLRRTLYGCVD